MNSDTVIIYESYNSTYGEYKMFVKFYIEDMLFECHGTYHEGVPNEEPPEDPFFSLEDWFVIIDEDVKVNHEEFPPHMLNVRFWDDLEQRCFDIISEW